MFKKIWKHFNEYSNKFLQKFGIALKKLWRNVKGEKKKI